VRRTKPHGPPARPRRYLNQPTFYDTFRASGRPSWLLAVQLGLTHPTVLSGLVCADSVPDTPINIERLERIADAIGFDRSQLFLDGAQ